MKLVSTKGKTIESSFATHEAAAEMLAKKTFGQSLSAKDRGFAQSLIVAYQKGRVSHDQLVWIHVLANEQHNVAAPATTMDFTPVLTLMSTALTAGLKNPKLRYPGLVVAVSYRTQKVSVFRVPGWTVLGDVEPGMSTLALSDKATPEEREQIAALAQSPVKIAHETARRTGNCVFCGLGLTTAESVGNGWGPICAEKWGLPWADSDAARRERDIRKLQRLADQMKALNVVLASPSPPPPAATD